MIENHHIKNRMLKLRPKINIAKLLFLITKNVKFLDEETVSPDDSKSSEPNSGSKIPEKRASNTSNISLA